MIRRPIGSMGTTDARNQLNEEQASSWTINTSKSTSWKNGSYITDLFLFGGGFDAGGERLHTKSCYSGSWSLLRIESRAWSASRIKTINRI